MAGGSGRVVTGGGMRGSLARVENERLWVDAVITGGTGPSGNVNISAVGGVAIGPTVPVSDGGGSLTVDGTVAVSSVGGTVTVVQPTHDNLNANANLQVGDVDVSNANPVPVSDAGGSLTVDGTVTVSGTVTVAGTVAVGPTVVPGTGATNLGKAEDAAHASGDTGVMALAVRNDIGTALAANGDYIPLMVNGIGHLFVAPFQPTHSQLNATVMVQGGNGSNLADVYQTGDPFGTQPFGIVPMGEVSSVGQWSHFLISGTGGLIVSVDSVTPGVGASNLGKQEDAAHANGDTGVMMLAVRKDTPTALAGDGDYIPLQTDNIGRLRISLDVQTIVFSGSTRGRPIQITGTTSGGANTLHTATTTSGQVDKMFMWLTNTSTAAVTVTVEFGTTGVGNELDYVVPGNETIIAIDGAVIGGAATDTIKAYATTASVVNAFGRVERLTS